MSLTPVTPTCSGWANGGVPSHTPGARRALHDRGGVPRLPGASPLGAGLRVPRVRWHRGVGHPARTLDVHGLWAPGVGDGGHDLRGHSYPADALVSGDLVGGQPEERRQRLGLAARPRFGQLPHGLDVAAQAPPRDGAARPGSGLGGGRGGRDHRRRGRAGRRTPAPRQEGPGGHCRRGTRPCHRAHPDAAGGGCLGRQPGDVRAARRRAW